MSIADSLGESGKIRGNKEIDEKGEDLLVIARGENRGL